MSTLHDPAPNADAAVEFLLQHEPEGPWAITAITVPLKKGDKKSLTTRTFGPGQEEKAVMEVAKWLKPSV